MKLNRLTWFCGLLCNLSMAETGAREVDSGSCLSTADPLRFLQSVNESKIPSEVMSDFTLNTLIADSLCWKVTKAYPSWVPYTPYP